MTALVGEALPSRALAKGYGLFALVTGVAAAVASPIGGWLYGVEPRLAFWTSAALMGAALVAPSPSPNWPPARAVGGARPGGAG